MDRHNNVLAVEIGRTARTWNDIEQGARDMVEGSSGEGSDGGAVWLPESQWSSHPKDPTTGEELPPENWNWPEIDWEGGSVESNPLYRYPYGGEEYRYEPAIDDPRAILDPAGPASDINPLSRPVASWSDDDLRRVMASPAYLQSHPGRARAHAMVREWFAQAEEGAPARVDATGRRVPERAMAAAPAGGACEVPVQAHSRQGGKIEVDAHCRSRPAA